MPSKIRWIKTSTGLTMFYDRSIVVKKGTAKYKKVMQLLKEDDNEQKIADYLFPAKQIANYTKNQYKVEGEEIVDSKTSTKLHPVLAKKLVEFVRGSYSYRAFQKFCDNLTKNPNKESVDSLYHFLEANHFPITADGCFLAYKRVNKKNGKLVDFWTGSLDNSVGSIVAMDRSRCNSSRSKTCSSGLHVAAFEYAKDFYQGSAGILVEVKVNPKDVVAVPYDYHNQKMRVCRYEVLREGTKEVSKSYLNAKYVAGKKEKKITVHKGNEVDFDFDKMTSRQIVDAVRKQTGERIKLSLKSKKSIVNRAKQILGKQGLNVVGKITPEHKALMIKLFKLGNTIDTVCSKFSMYSKPQVSAIKAHVTMGRY